MEELTVPDGAEVTLMVLQNSVKAKLVKVVNIAEELAGMELGNILLRYSKFSAEDLKSRVGSLALPPELTVVEIQLGVHANHYILLREGDCSYQTAAGWLGVSSRELKTLILSLAPN